MILKDAKRVTSLANLKSDDLNWLINNAYFVSTKYGEAASELACEMYEAVAAAAGVVVKSADPAELASFDEVARAIQGSIKNSKGNDKVVAGSVGRLVKRSAEDTTLKNARRDGAEAAWVPSGDSCPFCIMLASRGWERTSSKSSTHAAHLHANCDCTYVVRFNGKGGVKGYDPQKYLDMYNDAEGSTYEEKLNSMRRAQYAENKDRINAQKRAAYAERKKVESGHGHN